MLLKDLITKASASLPTELTPEMTVGKLEINKLYFTKGYECYCDYLLFIKDDNNYLNLFYAWSEDGKTLRFSEVPDGKINFNAINLDAVSQFSSAVCDLFSPNKTLGDMAGIMNDIYYLYNANDFKCNVL